MLRRLIYRLSIRLWHVGHVTNWLARLPWIGPRLAPRLFDPDDSQAIMIPVQETIHAGKNVVLPFRLLPVLIGLASHRAVLNHCMCREAEACTEKPQELGCLFLGEGATRIDPALGRRVSQHEALSHIARAMVEGLLPTILHSTVDAFMLQIPYRQMLAICFCCECCCTIRKGIRAGPPAAWETVTRLPGLEVTVRDGCVGCGTCVDQCPVQAIAVIEGKATISNVCKGCGRCVAACPESAIELHIDGVEDAAGSLVALVEARTAIAG